jgi:cysteine-rich repeat protein
MQEIDTMALRSASSLYLATIVGIGAAAACSVVNMGEDPIEPGSSSTTTTSSSSSGTGGEGGTGGCGDGDTVSPEECDDNGESATCDDDCTLVECLDGNTNETAGETCDDGDESATCDADCTDRVCGDGTTNTLGGEECDDSNTAGNDGCSASCVIEGKCSAPAALDLVADGSGWLATMNWATSGLSLVTAADCDGQTDIGQGPDRVFEMVLDNVSAVHIELTGPGWDPIVRVMLAACNPATEIVEDGTNTDGCSDVGNVGAVEHLDYAALDAGTYYIVVDGAEVADEGPFTLTVGIQ